MLFAEAGYKEALEMMVMPTLYQRRETLCKELFQSICEKFNFPRGYLPEGEMWFSENLRRRLIGAILEESCSSSGLVPTITFSACALSSSDGVIKLRCCSKKEKGGVAKLPLDGDPVLLLSVFERTRRTTSPLQISTLRGNLISPSYLLRLIFAILVQTTKPYFNTSITNNLLNNFNFIYD